MSGFTISITGSSNDSKLVLSSDNGHIHDDGHPHDHPHDHPHEHEDLKTRVTTLEQSDSLQTLDIANNTSGVAQNASDLVATNNLLAGTRQGLFSIYDLTQVNLGRIQTNDMVETMHRLGPLNVLNKQSPLTMADAPLNGPLQTIMKNWTYGPEIQTEFNDFGYGMNIKNPNEKLKKIEELLRKRLKMIDIAPKTQGGPGFLPLAISNGFNNFLEYIRVTNTNIGAMLFLPLLLTDGEIFTDGNFPNPFTLTIDEAMAKYFSDGPDSVFNIFSRYVTKYKLNAGSVNDLSNLDLPFLTTRGTFSKEEYVPEYLSEVSFNELVSAGSIDEVFDDRKYYIYRLNQNFFDNSDCLQNIWGVKFVSDTILGPLLDPANNYKAGDVIPPEFDFRTAANGILLLEMFGVGMNDVPLLNFFPMGHLGEILLRNGFATKEVAPLVVDNSVNTMKVYELLTMPEAGILGQVFLPGIASLFPEDASAAGIAVGGGGGGNTGGEPSSWADLTVLPGPNGLLEEDADGNLIATVKVINTGKDANLNIQANDTFWPGLIKLTKDPITTTRFSEFRLSQLGDNWDSLVVGNSGSEVELLKTQYNGEEWNVEILIELNGNLIDGNKDLGQLEGEFFIFEMDLTAIKNTPGTYAVGVDAPWWGGDAWALRNNRNEGWVDENDQLQPPGAEPTKTELGNNVTYFTLA